MQLGEYRIKYILLCLVGYPAVGPLSILKIQQAILSGILLHSRWRRGVGAPASAGGGWRWAAMEGRSRSEGVAAGGGADGPGGATAGRTAVDAKAALSL